MKDIIFMTSVYKDYIWGGNRLKKEFDKKCNYDQLAESWEISANKNGDCKIMNEKYKGKTLSNLFDNMEIKKELFGNNCLKYKEFPIIIKLIDAKDNLSIQVHPDDDYAKKIGLLNGKNEVWYIIDCERNSQLIGGFAKDINKENLKNVIYNNKVKDYINYINVKSGDAIYIPAGVLHAILGGILICEIQQNSDVTYRVYDWDRVDKNGNSRQLHKEESLNAINIKKFPEIQHINGEKKCCTIIDNNYFKVEKINCNESFEDTSNLNTFYAMTVVDGEGYIYTESEKINIKKGNSFLIPATLGNYKIVGKIQLLKTSIT